MVGSYHSGDLIERLSRGSLRSRDGGSRDETRNQLTSTYPVDKRGQGEEGIWSANPPALMAPNPNSQGAGPSVNPLARELANIIGGWMARQKWGA